MSWRYRLARILLLVASGTVFAGNARTISVAEKKLGRSAYSQQLPLDLSRVPFSRYGSYLAFSYLSAGPMGSGLYLRSIHSGVRPEIFRVDVISSGAVLPFRVSASPVLLRLQADAGFVEICVGEPNALNIRGHRVGIRFSKPAENVGYFLPRSDRQWEFSAAQQDVRLMLTASRGELQVAQKWNGTDASSVTSDFLPSTDGKDLEARIEEFRSDGALRQNLLGLETHCARSRVNTLNGCRKCQRCPSNSNQMRILPPTWSGHPSYSRKEI